MILKILLYDDRCVMTPKSKCIAEGSTNGAFLGLPESKIQFWVQSIIIGEMVDGRGHYVMHDGFDTGNGFYDTSCTQEMAGHGFG